MSWMWKGELAGPSFCKMQLDNFDTIRYLNDQFLNCNQVLGFATSLHDSFKMMR